MSMETKTTEYRLTDADADTLKGAVLQPHDLRVEILRRYVVEHGTGALVDLFAQFIGLANSVVANNRETMEMMLIVEGGEHPYPAEKINLATVFGALCGVTLANGVDYSRACHGCAYRLGTPANQSPVTTCEADWCGHDGEPDFWCHERLNDQGEPTARCIGHALRRSSGRRGRRHSEKVTSQ